MPISMFMFVDSVWDGKWVEW